MLETMASSVASTFQQTLTAFKVSARLSQAEVAEFQMTSLDDLKRQIAIIQENQRKSKKMVYLKRLGPFLDTVEQYGRVVEVFLNTSNVVAFIWGPMKLLLMITRNFVDGFNALLEAYASLAEEIPQLAQFQQLFESDPHMQSVLALVFEDLLEFHREALKYFKQRSWKEIFHATWRSFSKTVEHLKQNLRRHRSLLESQATITQIETFRDFRIQVQTAFHDQRASELERTRLSMQQLQEFQHFREQAQKARDDLKASELDRRRQMVHQWLCPLDYHSRQEDAAKTRHGETGKWLINDQRFTQWYSFDYCSSALLWLSGIPGAGKTVLASHVVEECQKLANVRTCFFYCRNSDVCNNAFVSVARVMLAQLVVGNELLLQYLYHHASESGQSVLSSATMAKNLLKTALNTCDKKQKTYIIVDGLDEYGREERKDITAWFKEQIAKVDRRDLGLLRCMFVSQDDGYARKDLTDCFTIKLEPKDTRLDIEAYCNFWHQRIAQKFGPLDPIAHNVTALVTARAQGMFLYAKLVIWNLYEQQKRHDFLHEIHPDRIPEGLDQAYDRIMNRIIGPQIQPRSRSENARKLLGWLVCAKRTLRWREIQGAVSIDLEEGIVNYDLLFLDSCKDICASLVELSSDGTVTLVHSTTRRYLVRHEHINESAVEFDLAHMCLAYLSFPQFDLNLSEDQIETTLLRGDYSFLDYASCFWATHLTAAVDGLKKDNHENSNILTEAIGVFLDIHWVGSKKRAVVSKTMEGRLSTLRNHESYERLAQAIVYNKNQLLPTGKGPSNDEVLCLSKAVQRIRTRLEYLGTSAILSGGDRNNLTKFYGSHWYKCGRMNCSSYFEGFSTLEQREDHISKHERSFVCLEDGCPQAVIGCATARDLQAHMNENHGIIVEDEAAFPDDIEGESSASASRSRKQTNVLQCEICGTRFTRAYNLKSHLRVHTDERPFVCEICGKAFTRSQDRFRHQALHSGEKKHQCRGVLKDGNIWGCGRRFARLDALARHFMSEAGRVCIRPSREEEAGIKLAAEKSQNLLSGEDEHRNMESNWDMLPTSFLAQYPALAGVDLNGTTALEEEDISGYLT